MSCFSREAAFFLYQSINNTLVTSTNGQVIHSSTMEGNAHQIDLSSLQSGVYIITISSKDFVETRKIIKLRK